jgi:hypothetical protein
MDRVCVLKSTGNLIELQKGGDDRLDLMESRLDTLRQNAINAGYAAGEIEVKWVTNEELAIIQNPPATFAEAQAKKIQDLADYRFQKETAGVTVNGCVIKTDEVSQAKLTGTWAKSQIHPNIEINWKGANGWVKINKADIEAIAAIVSDHVEACYDNEKVHYDAIMKLKTVEQIIAYNYTTGWPE